MKPLEDFGLEHADLIKKRAAREYANNIIEKEQFDEIDKIIKELKEKIKSVKS